MLAHCSPSSKWVHVVSTGEIKSARKGTGHPTSHCRWLRISVLSTYKSVGDYFYKSERQYSKAMSSLHGHQCAFFGARKLLVVYLTILSLFNN